MSVKTEQGGCRWKRNSRRTREKLIHRSESNPEKGVEQQNGGHLWSEYWQMEGRWSRICIMDNWVFARRKNWGVDTCRLKEAYVSTNFQWEGLHCCCITRLERMVEKIIRDWHLSNAMYVYVWKWHGGCNLHNKADGLEEYSRKSNSILWTDRPHEGIWYRVTREVMHWCQWWIGVTEETVMLVLETYEVWKYTKWQEHL